MEKLERLVIRFCDQSVEVRCPATIADQIRSLFPENLSRIPRAKRLIEVRVDAPAGVFNVHDDLETEPEERLPLEHLASRLMDGVVRALIHDLSSSVALHAGAVTRDGNCIIVPGQTGAGKSSLVAWLIDNGFEYLSDEIVVLGGERLEIEGLRRALVIKSGAAEHVARLATFQELQPIASGDSSLYAPPANKKSSSDRLPVCNLIVLPRFVSGSDLRIETMTPAKAGLRLMECNLNARNLQDGGLQAIGALARSAPAISLQYGDFDQLAGIFDILARMTFADGSDPGSIRRFLSALTPATPIGTTTTTAAAKTYPVPPPTPHRTTRKALTIGMATYDDYDGVYFSLQAMRLYQPDVIEDVEFIVIDNHPNGPCAEALKSIETDIPNYRYIPMNAHSGTAVRDFVFAEARGDNVLCMDCHVLLAPRAVGRLLRYFQDNPDTQDLLQGPMVSDNLVAIATHFDPVWRKGMFGVWGTDARGEDPDAPPFEIPMQGLGVFACRAAVWPGFNTNFRGFGGEEGYIHEKFRQRGGRTLCLPFLRWVHRFKRPMGVPYPNSWDDRVRNYLIGHRELGLSTQELEDHYIELLGESPAVALLKRIKLELDAAGETERPA